MKPTSDDFLPRRDGWYEHRGTWAEVTVGTVLADQNSRTKRWEIIAVAHGHQVQYGYTLWMRAREQTTGEEISVEPRNKTALVTILTRNPADTQTAGPTWPTDSDAIMLLVEQLGATLLASRDAETGEITCPDYAIGASHRTGEKGNRLAEIEHLRIAHGMTDISDETSLADVTTLHGQAHHPRWPNIGKGGFPHRHVPEDLTFFTGMS